MTSDPDQPDQAAVMPEPATVARALAHVNRCHRRAASADEPSGSSRAAGEELRQLYWSAGRSPG